MPRLGSDFYFDRWGLKKADALQMFWLFAVAVAVPAVAVLALPALLNIIQIIDG